MPTYREGAEPVFVALMSSVYTRQRDAWRLALPGGQWLCCVPRSPGLLPWIDADELSHHPLGS